MPAARTAKHKSNFVPVQADVASPLYSWDDVQYFLELGTLVRAARRLGVSHTTVLRRIMSLERCLDQKLFDRTARGFVLTEAGLNLLQHAELMERAADGIGSLREAKIDLSGRVRVAAVEGFAAKVLTPAVPVFQAKHPDIVPEIVTAMLAANLTKREADISIGLTRPTGPRLVTRRLAFCDVHLYAAQSYIARYGEPKGLQEFGRNRFVDYIEDMIEIPAIKWLRGAVGQQHVIYRSTSPLSQLNAVTAGIGIGMFPAYMTDGQPSLKRIMPGEIAVAREFWIAIHEELRGVPRMDAVFKFIKSTVHASHSFRP